MFKFLKDKLKNVVSGFSKKVEEEAEEVKEELTPALEKRETAPEKKEGAEEVAETGIFVLEKKKIKEEAADEKEQVKEVEEKKGFFEKIRQKFKPKEEKQKAEEEKPDEKEAEEKGFVEKITEKVIKKVISEQKFDELFYDLELALLENNVAVEVIDKIKADLKKQLVGKPLTRSRIQEIIMRSLRSSIEDLFIVQQIDLLQRVNEKKPFVILFVGINGSGKTTTIAKIAKLLQDNNLKPVIAASDTFRAAAIQQLEKHASSLGIKLIKHDYGADPAAVAFDAIKYAQAHSLDAVLIDTAGRLHSNVNLVEEMKKIARVAKPDMKIFVGESITGNDCVEQARKFNEAIGIDAIILAKADVDEKGGAAISVSYVTNKPIIYLGTGQNYSDLQPFSSEIIVESLGLAA
jgi:fused signal recognition particle receptor